MPGNKRKEETEGEMGMRRKVVSLHSGTNRLFHRLSCLYNHNLSYAKEKFCCNTYFSVVVAVYFPVLDSLQLPASLLRQRLG